LPLLISENHRDFSDLLSAMLSMIFCTARNATTVFFAKENRQRNERAEGNTTYETIWLLSSISFRPFIEFSLPIFFSEKTVVRNDMAFK